MEIILFCFQILFGIIVLAAIFFMQRWLMEFQSRINAAFDKLGEKEKRKALQTEGLLNLVSQLNNALELIVLRLEQLGKDEKKK